MKTKRCKRECNTIKSFDEFYNCKTNIDGKEGSCKVCRKKKRQIWYAENKEIHNINTKKYYQENKEKASQYSRDWYIANREHRLYIGKKWSQENKDKVNIIARRFREKNKNKLSNNFSRSIYSSLKGNKNGRKWESLIGYSLDDLVVHLEKLFSKK